ncbi:MAG: endonuclease/exonuclease/phosphatase family protein [Chitinophagaceae bacterium]
MAGRYKLFVIRLFVVLNVLVAIAFLLACLAPYSNPSRWWAISLLGLGFGIIFILLVLFFFFWAIVKPRFILLSLVPLLIGFKSIAVFFAIHTPDKFSYVKPEGTLRVMTWNVARFLELKRNNNPKSQIRLKMLDLIKAQNADVLCLQEFYHSTDSTYYNNIDAVKKLGYPYFYYSWDEDGHKQWFGQAIFSKYKIVDSGLVHYPRPGQPESLIHADILFGGDTVRFYTTHLQSVKFKEQDYRSLEEIKQRDSVLENSRNIFSKLRRGFGHRSRQADIVAEITSLSPHPYIVTGDFNDVPNSYTYFTIRGNDLQDAFLKKGFGIGRTYSGISPTLRIDYILPTKHFNVLQFNRLVKAYSDHYMLLADVELAPPQKEK